MSSQTRGVLLVALASLCLSTAPTVIKFGFSANVDPVAQLTVRLWIGVAGLWLVFFLTDPSKLRIDRSGLLACALVGGANTISLLSFYISVTMLDVSVAIVLFSAFPAFTLVLLSFGGEHIARLHWVRIALAMLGVYLLVGPGGQVNTQGVLLVILTAIFYSIHLALIQWRLSHYSARTITAYIIGFMALYMTCIYLATGHGWPRFPAEGWGVVVWTGLVATAIARLAMFSGIRRIGSAQTALLGPLETLLAVLWAILFLSDHLSWIQWLGGGLILFSASLAAASGNKSGFLGKAN